MTWALLFSFTTFSKRDRQIPTRNIPNQNHQHVKPILLSPNLLNWSNSRLDDRLGVGKPPLWFAHRPHSTGSESGPEGSVMSKHDLLCWNQLWFSVPRFLVYLSLFLSSRRISRVQTRNPRYETSCVNCYVIQLNVGAWDSYRLMVQTVDLLLWSELLVDIVASPGLW